MDGQDKHRFVQQYVERQRAYLSTYTTTEHPWSERHGTPAKLGDFGFDTPVLRPRVPLKKASPEVGPYPAIIGEATLEVQDPASSKKAKLFDTDDERAARLADRRERRRKKRAIVNPPQEKHDDDTAPTTAQKKGKTKGQKAKKPAALALLYGFSATNVTKNRLTLKPAPSLGVFSKGRASAKKQVTATRKSSSRKEVFSESMFLNKPEQAADHSKVVDDSDDSSVSSISNDPMPQATCTTNHPRKDQGKCTETTTLKVPQASIRATAESEVWDIELQSKLPSSARDVSSEPEASGSAPVVLDIRGAEWSASLNVAGEHEERCNKTQTRSLSVCRGHSVVHSSPLALSDLHDEHGHPHAANTLSIHPSHSASQVGRRVADIQPSDVRQVMSKYFTEPKGISVQEFATKSLQTSRSSDGFDVRDFRVADPNIQDVALDAEMIPRAATPIDTLIGGGQPMVEQYDVAPLAFPSDCSLYDDGYAWADVPSDRPGNFEIFVMETQAEHCHPGWEPEHEDDLEEPVSALELAEWRCAGEGEGEAAVYEDDGSICWDRESGEGVAEFLEGRALLLGVPEWPRSVGLSALAQAEMDVASRLRDHWRPQRLS